MTDQLTHLGDLVDQLCDTTTTEIPLHTWSPSRHKRMTAVTTIRHQPLIDALATAIHGRGHSEQGGGRSVPGSRPPLDLGALDRYRAIEQGVDHWRNVFGTARRDNLKSDLRGLVGGASTAYSGLVDQLAAEAGKWVSWCRVIAGWDTPAWRPNAPCPVVDCGAKALRVRLDKRTAICVACGETWGNDRIELLGRHIHATTATGDAA